MDRVVILSSYYYPVIGGVESHARTIAAYLSDKTDIFVITSRLGYEQKSIAEVDGIAVRRVGFRGQRNTLMKWLLLPFAFFALVRNRQRYDVIYCPGFQGIGLAAIAAAKILRKKIVVQAGNFGVVSCVTWDGPLRKVGLNPNGRIARCLKYPFRRVYAAADVFLCIAKSMSADLDEEGIEPSRIHYIPNSVDTDLFRPASGDEKRAVRLEEGWPPDKRIAMFVGRLGREKGILDLIDAWRIVDRKGWYLIIVGPDMPGHAMDVGEEARTRVAAHSLSDKLKFVGSRDDVSRLLRAADLFIQPSHYEAFGISVIEAMAVGLPVVATRVGGMLDYLDETNAVLCNPNDPDDLAAAIGAVQRRQDFGAQLGRNGLALARGRFSESIVLEQYRSVLAGDCPEPVSS